MSPGTDAEPLERIASKTNAAEIAPSAPIAIRTSRHNDASAAHRLDTQRQRPAIGT